MAGESKKPSGHHAKGQGHHTGGQGHHSHDHDRHSDRRPARQRPTSSAQRETDHSREHLEVDEPEVTQSVSAVSVEDGDVTVLTNGDERVFITRDEDEEGDRNNNKGEDGKEGGSQNSDLPSPPLTPPLPKKLTRDDYDIRSFNSSLNEFVGVLSDKRYQEVTDDYPVDDLVSVVSMVSATIEEYKEHSKHTQKQLETLRNTMRTVKENIRLSYSRQAFDLSQEEAETIEEKELKARLTKLNATVAAAHAEVAEADKLSAEAENTALQAHLAAEQAKKEAQRIQEELALREETEKRRVEEEKRKREEEVRKCQEEERRKAEEQRAEELAWKRKQEAAAGLKKGAVWEQWPVYEYDTTQTPSRSSGSIIMEEEIELLCCVRGHPVKFNKERATVDVIDQLDIDVKYAPHEELISRILKIESTKDKETLEEPLYVAIPHVMTRGSAMSRETVVKCLQDGQWVERTATEVHFERYKDMKFVQFELQKFTTFLVMSRFKRDYVTLTKRAAKVTSSYDQRIVLNVKKFTFKNSEHLLLQVQPVDSGSVSDYRSHDEVSKNLLTSSPIIHTEWQTKENFSQPINISLPCPPNPAKARKMAMLRKQKDERMKGAKPPAPVLEDKDKEKEKPKLQQAQAQAQAQAQTSKAEGEEGAPPVSRRTKWYMGQYGQTEDDENDQLWFLGFQGVRWVAINDMNIVQVRLDLVNLNLDTPWERFMILRTRPGLESETLVKMAKGINEHLARRFVNAVVKQRTDDPFEMCLYVVPVARLEKLLQQLTEEGYDDGPEHSHTISLYEGDAVAVDFGGNVRNMDETERTLRLVYNSNIATETYFTVREVDRYLQKNFSMFRGVLHVMKRYEVLVISKKKGSEDEPPAREVRFDPLCDLMIKIPKYHVEPLPTPRRAPVILHPSECKMDQNTLRALARELGDEWRRLANKLQVQRVRIQAILRMVQAGQGSEEQAKYDMLMTWLKRSPQAADKRAILCRALRSVGRTDLADQLRML